MAKPTPSKFVLSILPFALVACGQSVTELGSRAHGSNLEGPGSGDAEAAETSEHDAGTNGSTEPAATATTEPDAENTAAPEPENTAAPEPENTAAPEPENTTPPEPENTTPPEPENTTPPEPTNAPPSPTTPTDGESTAASVEDSTSAIDPRPEKPGRGIVLNGEADFSATGCCSRVTGAPLDPFCPPGQGSTTFGELTDGSDTLHGPDSPASLGVPFEISPATPLSEPVQFAIEETTIDPPTGILDLSPVYWVWSASEDDIRLLVQVPISSMGFVPEVDAVHIFFSPDGAEYSQLDDDYLNAGFLEGTLPGPGFVVAGVTDPAGIQCF